LFHHTSKSKDNVSALKAKLSDLAHSFCGTPVDLNDFTMHKECLVAIKSFRNNNNIVITKAGKSSAVVILDKSDYIVKMNIILGDNSKFCKIGPVVTKDNTAIIEGKIQRHLLELQKGNLLAESIYKAIRPSGSQKPKLYGLPKTHKKKMYPFALYF